MSITNRHKESKFLFLDKGEELAPDFLEKNRILQLVSRKDGGVVIDYVDAETVLNEEILKLREYKENTLKKVKYTEGILDNIHGKWKQESNLNTLKTHVVEKVTREEAFRMSGELLKTVFYMFKDDDWVI